MYYNMANREHEQEALKVPKIVFIFHGLTKAIVKGRAENGGEVQEENALLVVVEITDSPPF